MAGSNFWVNTQPGPTFSGGTTVGGGGSAGVVQYRDPLDAARSMATQDSAYPDGYLGTITDRHQDKLLAKVQQRLNDRSYQRGVHVGSRVGRDQYFWPADLNMESGLERQAQAVMVGNVIETPRFAPTGTVQERLAHMGKAVSVPETRDVARAVNVNPGLSQVVVQDPARREQLARMLPRYA